MSILVNRTPDRIPADVIAEEQNAAIKKTDNIEHMPKTENIQHVSPA